MKRGRAKVRANLTRGLPPPQTSSKQTRPKTGFATQWGRSARRATRGPRGIAGVSAVAPGRECDRRVALSKADTGNSASHRTPSANLARLLAALPDTCVDPCPAPRCLPGRVSIRVRLLAAFPDTPVDPCPAPRCLPGHARRSVSGSSLPSRTCVDPCPAPRCLPGHARRSVSGSSLPSRTRPAECVRLFVVPTGHPAERVRLLAASPDTCIDPCPAPRCLTGHARPSVSGFSSSHRTGPTDRVRLAAVPPAKSRPGKAKSRLGERSRVQARDTRSLDVTISRWSS
jgi:hypothetical protein